MRRHLLAYSTLCGTGLLFACAAPPPAPTLTVAPVQAVSGVNDRADGYYQLGRYYQGQNRLDQAADAYRKALAVDGKLVDARNALGAVYAAQGRLDEAVVEFIAVAEASPAASYAWNNLGYAYMLQGRTGDAIPLLERAIALDQANRRAWNNLGTVLAQRGDLAAANEKFARAAELGTAPMASGAASPAAAPAVVPAGPPAASPVTVIAALSTVAAPEAPVVPSDVPPAASPVAVIAASANAGAALSPTIGSVTPPEPPVVKVAAAKAALGLSDVPDNTSAPGVPERATAASAAVQSSAPAAGFSEPSKGTPPRWSAVVDNADSGKLVQLAPNVFELRTAAIPPATAVAASSAQGFGLELSNGNGVTGMAKRLGEQLAAAGLPRARLTNQKPFQQIATEIQYRNGYADEAWALRRRLPNQPTLIRAEGLHASTDVRLVLGKDLPRDVALLDVVPEAMRLAAAAQDAAGGRK